MSEMHDVIMRLSVPFCTKQPAFDAVTKTEGRDTRLIHAYVMAMAIELKQNAPEFEDCRVCAIRLDGGSASILEGSDLERLLKLVSQSYHLSEDCRISMRTCPADINGANMPFFNRAHIDRYDLEMYSMEPEDFHRFGTLNYLNQLPYITHGFLRADQKENMGQILLYGKKDVSRYGFRRSVL